MRISARLPNSGPLPRALGIERMAQTAVDAGATGLWVSDHLLMQGTLIENYPYTADGRIPWDAEEDYFEALATCAFLVGAIDSDCTIGTAVLILPQRNVLQTAKEIATIDRLSGGRLRLGLGVGWNDAEMEALGHRFATRGRRFDEMLTVLRDAWHGRTSGFKGEELHVDPDLLLNPTPVTADGPPLLIGGMSKPALRRAATLGDGWIALASVDRWDARAMTAAAENFHAAWVDADRSTAPSTVLGLHCSEAAMEQLPRRIEEAADLGFDEVIIPLQWARGLDEAAREFSRIVDEWR
jgi:probable F420-dependent oxidoreductase